MSFGALLEQARTDRRMTQADVAKASGIPASAISHFERDRRLPSLRNFAKLVSALWLDPRAVTELVLAAKEKP